MNKLRDNLVRVAFFDGYVNRNIVRLVIQLGLDVIVKVHVKLKNVYVKDENGVREFFDKLNMEQPMTVQMYERPPNHAYCLVELFDANEFHINRQLLELNLATPWGENYQDEDRSNA